VGNSRSKGFEGMVEFDPSRMWFGEKGFALSAFASYAYNDARYGDFTVITRNSSHQLVTKNLKDQKVENAPEHILRTGITGGYRKFSLTGQLSHVSAAFSDANNTVKPTANAQNGIIPAYTVIDLTAVYKINAKLNLKAGVNNLLDAKYFTRRAGGYPGPGALPSDGRAVWVSFGARL
jgi:Fe(3+) dicitrate transport protein